MPQRLRHSAASVMPAESLMFNADALRQLCFGPEPTPS